MADESCDFAVVRALRTAGHDVTAVAENWSGADDEVVARIAAQEGRILITEDKDFGRLAYTGSIMPTSILFVRYPAHARTLLAEAVRDLVTRHGEHLTGKFVILQPGRVRVMDPRAS